MVKVANYANTISLTCFLSELPFHGKPRTYDIAYKIYNPYIRSERGSLVGLKKKNVRKNVSLFCRNFQINCVTTGVKMSIRSRLTSVPLWFSIPTLT